MELESLGSYESLDKDLDKGLCRIMKIKVGLICVECFQNTKSLSACVFLQCCRLYGAAYTVKYLYLKKLESR